MRAAVLRSPGQPLVFEDRLDLQPAGTQRVVRVLAAGVCHSDLHMIDGVIGGPLPRVIDSYADFFRREPGFRNVFYHAQRSPELEQAQRQNDRDMASRLHDLLRTGYGLSDPGLATRCLIAVQVADHLLGLAFRDNPDGDATVAEEAKLLLRRYLGI